MSIFLDNNSVDIGFYLGQFFTNKSILKKNTICSKDDDFFLSRITYTIYIYYTIYYIYKLYYIYIYILYYTIYCIYLYTYILYYYYYYKKDCGFCTIYTLLISSLKDNRRICSKRYLTTSTIVIDVSF